MNETSFNTPIKLHKVKVHKVVLDGTSDNMASLSQTGKYGAINEAYIKNWDITL